MTSEAQRRAFKKYREKVKRLTLSFSPAEADMWAHIQAQPRKQTYIKNLIRADMARQEGKTSNSKSKEKGEST